MCLKKSKSLGLIKLDGFSGTLNTTKCLSCSIRLDKVWCCNVMLKGRRKDVILIYIEVSRRSDDGVMGELFLVFFFRLLDISLCYNE